MTDFSVVVLAVADGQNISATEICIPFGMGKDFKLISVHVLASQLELESAQVLPVFNAFTGCDTLLFSLEKEK